MTSAENIAHLALGESNLPFEDAFVVPRWFCEQNRWVAEPESSNSPVYNYPLALRMRGRLVQGALRQALAQVVRRQQMLRSVFRVAGENLIQIVLPPPPLEMEVREIAGRDEADKEKTALALIAEEAQRPLDLVRGPVLRPQLFRLADQDHILLLTTHHLVCDDWSGGILFQRVSTFYSHFVNGDGAPLPELSSQYGEFVRGLERQLHPRELETRISFWKERLGHQTGDFYHLPTDYPRPSRRTYRGAEETSFLTHELTKAVTALSQRERVTPFMTMFVAFQCLLHKYSGDSSIAIGSCGANRLSLETEGLIGRFGNDVLLWTEMSGNPTFRELLQRARETALTAYSYQDLPFGALVHALRPSPDPSRNPLFQIMFIFQNAPKDSVQFPGLVVETVRVPSRTAKYDLNVWLRGGDGLTVTMEYNRDLFERSTMQRILRDYRAILERALGNPALRLNELSPSIERRPTENLAVKTSPAESLPASGTECQLVKIWEGLFRRKVSVDDDFFGLGGDSLMAARLFQQIENDFQIRVPIAALFDASTIRQLAKLIKRDVPVKWSPLVAIQRGGSRPPLFFVHGAGGNVLFYGELARQLGPDQPFYGLQSQGLDGRLPLLERIEEMAALYIKEIQRVQPQGPYFIGGYCMGGTVAFEMAQQLKAAGHEVALVALLDTSNWSQVTTFSFADTVRFYLEKMAFHWKNFMLLGKHDRLLFLREKLKVTRGRAPVWLGSPFVRLLGKESGHHQSLLFAQLWHSNEHAAFAYQPRAYEGCVLQLRPLQQYSRYSGPDHGWSAICSRGVEAVSLSVYPGGMLVEPFVKDAAAALKEHMNKLMGNGFAVSAPHPAACRTCC